MHPLVTGAQPDTFSRRTRRHAVELVARVYSGIHFRTSDEVGARLGRQVAHFVVVHALRTGEGVVTPVAPVTHSAHANRMRRSQPKVMKTSRGPEDFGMLDGYRP
jgi:hypothetical protein